MTKKLKHYFPILWEKKELLRKIRTTPTLSAIFDSWTFERQEELDEVQEALDQTKGELDQTKGELAQALKRIKELEAR